MSLHKFAFCAGLVFFLVAFFTNNHYGVSWDEPEHFLRGQAYLRFFLTGEENYNDLPAYEPLKAREDKDYHERSYYQHDSSTAANWFISDAGHPPLNDILASFFNFVFYQKLGLFSDIESYHIFNITISSILVAVVFLFAAKTFGIWSGIFSAIFLATYPLFFAESHFNVKDPVQSAFFVLSIYFFWKSIDENKVKFITASSLFAGFAFAVKLNILFLPFILGPWVFLLLLKKKKIKSFIFSKKVILTVIFFPAVMLAILVSSWPFIWQDVIGNLLSVFNYYKELGTEESFNLDPTKTWNFYAILWILYTTPPVTLFFFFLGLICFGQVWKKSSFVFVLWILLFFVSVGRVSFPNTTIYGGVRQIMEYIPAMALIAGVGADMMRKWFQVVLNKKQAIFLVLLILLLNVAVIYKIHPNENVYFNFLVGGINGAKEKNIPSWGNSYGNAYYQAIKWINSNAEFGGRVSLIQGTSLNIPTVLLRPDLDFSNSYWSGIYRRGEYIIELTHQSKKLYPYAWNYVERMLEPVYEIKVDGVAIAKVWKNDLDHTRIEFKKAEKKFSGVLLGKAKENMIVIDAGEDVYITRLVIKDGIDDCSQKLSVSTSLDGDNWVYEEDLVPTEQVAYPEKGGHPIFFAATKARFIKLEGLKGGMCSIFNDPIVELYILEN